MTLSRKHAFITGGARGQGRSHAFALARRGVDVALVDLPVGVAIESTPVPLSRASDLQQTAEEVRSFGVRCLTFEADVRDRDAVVSAVDETVAEFGSVDYVAANAGIFSWSRIEDMPEPMWRDMIDVNLTGVFHTFHAVAGHLARQDFGRVVATASMAGRGGFAHLSHYTAAKWGLIGLAKSFALEMAEFGTTVNVVAPTNCDTPMLNNPAAYEFFAGKPGATREDAAEQAAAMLPIDLPWIQPEDVTAAFLYLFSDGARYVNGEVLHVSGGMSASNAV